MATATEQDGDGRSEDRILEPGEVIRGTKLIVEEVLGEGGQGIVYRAFHPELEKHRVVKILHRAEPETTARIKLEGVVLARIDHERVVKVHDSGILPSGRAYLELEWVDGEPLSRLLKREGGYLPVVRAVRIAREICEGLAAAHRHGVIHRDVKPGNVLVTRDKGSVKLFDFGIAMKVQQEIKASVLTKKGHLPGTPELMAPEQALSLREQISPATDLYAVGGTVFRMLTGRYPFVAENRYDFLHHQINTPPPALASVGRGGPFPIELENLVARLLAKDPRDRPQSARDVAAEFGRIEQDLGVVIRANGAPDADGSDLPTMNANYDAVTRVDPKQPNMADSEATTRDDLPALRKTGPSTTVAQEKRGARAGMLAAIGLVAVIVIAGVAYAAWPRSPTSVRSIASTSSEASSSPLAHQENAPSVGASTETVALPVPTTSASETIPLPSNVSAPLKPTVKAIASTAPKLTPSAPVPPASTVSTVPQPPPVTSSKSQPPHTTADEMY